MSLVNVPLKTIIAFHMDLPQEPIPPGWAVCNGAVLDNTVQDINPGGTYTLPDLRNYFLIGADSHKNANTPGATVNTSNVNLPAGAPGPKGRGGENQHKLTVAEIPGHTHPYPFPHIGTIDSYGPVSTALQGGHAGIADRFPTDLTGGDIPHENRPLYYGVVWLMKVKN